MISCFCSIVEDTRYTTQCESIVQHVCEEHYKVTITIIIICQFSSLVSFIHTVISFHFSHYSYYTMIVITNQLIINMIFITIIILQVAVPKPVVFPVPIFAATPTQPPVLPPPTYHAPEIKPPAYHAHNTSPAYLPPGVRRSRRQLSLSDPALLSRQVKQATVLPPQPAVSHQVIVLCPPPDHHLS